MNQKVVPGLGPQTGANLINVCPPVHLLCSTVLNPHSSLALQIMQNVVSLALYTSDNALLADAYERAMQVVVFSDGVQEDGIHRDGSFLQHSGLLYNGNYGKDLLLYVSQSRQQVVPSSVLTR